MASGRGPYFEAFLRKHQYQVQGPNPTTSSNSSSLSSTTTIPIPTRSHSTGPTSTSSIGPGSFTSTVHKQLSSNVESTSITTPLLPAPIVPDRDRLITDRNAYIHYLENQIERICQMTLTTENNAEYIQQHNQYVHTIQDSINRMQEQNRVNRSITDKQGTEIGNTIAGIHTTIQEIQGKQEAYVLTLAQLSSQYTTLQSYTDNLSKEYHTNYEELQTKYTNVTKELENHQQQYNQLQSLFTTYQQETNNKFTDIIQQMQQKILQLEQRVTNSQQAACDSAESAKAIYYQAQKTADMACTAEAAAIDAKEEALNAYNNAKYAVEQLQSIRDQTVIAADKACVAEIQAKAALQAVLTTKPKEIVSSSTIEPSFDSSSVLRSTFSSPLSSNINSTLIENAIIDVLQVSSQHIDKLTTRIESIEKENKYIQQSLEEYQQVNRTYISTVMEDLSQRIDFGINEAQKETIQLIDQVKLHTTTITAATAEDLEKRIEQVATFHLQSETTLRQEINEQYHKLNQKFDAIYTLFAKYDLQLTDQEQMITKLQSFMDSLETKVYSIMDELSIALGLPTPSKTGGESSTVIPSPAWTKDLDILKTSVFNQITSITTNILNADTERKQVLRFTDELIQKYTENYSTIQQLQNNLRTLALQIETIKEESIQYTSNNNMNKEDTKEQPISSSSTNKSTTNTDSTNNNYQLTSSELLRLVDSVIQPRILEFFNERETQITEKITTINHTLQQASELLMKIQDEHIHIRKDQEMIPEFKSELDIIQQTINKLQMVFNKEQIELQATNTILNKRMDSLEETNKQLFENTEIKCTKLHADSENYINKWKQKYELWMLYLHLRIQIQHHQPMYVK